MNAHGKRIALITGATSGIGAEYARRFASEGYDLILTGRRKTKIKALADEIVRDNHVNVDVILVELADHDEVQSLLKRLEGKAIEVLINNAGFGTTRFFHKEPLQIQENMVSVHILCTMKLTYAVLPSMLRRKTGIIINVSSAGAFLVTPNEATYCGTKAFLRAFSEALYLELIGTGVKVQAVCPGLTRTDMPIRLGIPEEHLVDRGSFKWITTKEVVDASMKCLKKNKVICIPGRLTKFQVFTHSILPEHIYYRFVYAYYKKYGWIEEN